MNGRRERRGDWELRAASVPAAAGLGFQDQQAVVMVTSRNSRVFREAEQVLILFPFAFPSWPILRMNSLFKLANAFWLCYSTGTWPFCVGTYLFLPSLSLWLDYKPLKDTVWIPSPSLSIRVILNYLTSQPPFYKTRFATICLLVLVNVEINWGVCVRACRHIAPGVAQVMALVL